MVMLAVTLVSALPLLADAVTTLAALVFFAVAVQLRRLRRRVLESPLPSFLTAAPLAPLSIVTDVLATGLVAGLVLLGRESWVAGSPILVATVALFLLLGSLRGQLVIAGLTGLAGGHEPARWALFFFDSLRLTWRPRWLLPALGTGMVVCVADFAAAYLLFGFVLPAGLMTALAVTCAVRLGTCLRMLPRAAEEAPTATLPAPEEQPVSWREDRAA